MSSPAVDQVAPAQQYQREWEGAGGSNADPDWRQAQAATELLNTQTVDKIIPLPCFECTLLLSMDDEQQNVLFSDQYTDTGTCKTIIYKDLFCRDLGKFTVYLSLS